MRKAFLIIGLVIMAMAIAGTGTRYYDAQQTPAAIRTACRLVMSAYDSASKQADRMNEATPQYQLANPYGPQDFWTTTQQAQLDKAQLVIQNSHRHIPDSWQLVGSTISDAASGLDPAAVARAEAVPDQTTLSGNYPVDPSRAGRGNLLGAVQAACIGRR